MLLNGLYDWLLEGTLGYIGLLSANIELSPFWNTSCLAELTYDLINNQCLCRKCSKPVTIQCSPLGFFTRDVLTSRHIFLVRVHPMKQVSFSPKHAMGGPTKRRWINLYNFVIMLSERRVALLHVYNSLRNTIQNAARTTIARISISARQRNWSSVDARKYWIVTGLGDILE